PYTTLFRSGEFKGEEEATLLIHVAGERADESRRLLLVGLGSHADFTRAALRRAAAVAVRAARASRSRALHFVLPQSGEPSRGALAALAEGAHLGLYDNGFYQKEDEEDGPPLERLNVVCAGDVEGSREELERARAVAESVNWARALADEPGLSLPPREFARRAAEMAADVGLKVESLDAAEIRARAMGGLLGVAQGSDEEPALIVVSSRSTPRRFARARWAGCSASRKARTRSLLSSCCATNRRARPQTTNSGPSSARASRSTRAASRLSTDWT